MKPFPLLLFVLLPAAAFAQTAERLDAVLEAKEGSFAQAAAVILPAAGLLDPGAELDAAFEQAIPWNGTSAGTPGTPVKFFGTSTTITGLQTGTAYEVWIRSPNANGERGYGYVVGTPGAGETLAAPSNVQVSTPEDTTRNLSVSWNKVDGADGFLYGSAMSLP